MEELARQIETKRKLVQSIPRDDMERAIEDRNVRSIERKRNTISKTVNEIDDLKVKIQEIRIQKGDSAEDIKAWTENIYRELDSWDKDMERSTKTTTAWKEQEEQQTKLRDQEIAAKARRDLFQEQLEFDKVKLEQRAENEMQMEKLRKERQAKQGTSAKLPKLVITKFNGTPLDWLRFWNQFEAEVDKADVAPVTKFSYLKELVDPKVKSYINGLPFSTEGYERAKNILKSKYGDTSEIINAYVQNIMSLPIIQGTNTGKIHDFYSKLLFNVQSLETLGKLREVTGYVRFCLDKLEGIRGDLVRTDDAWRQWDFIKLVDALRKWTERNPIKVNDKSNDKSDKHASFGKINAFQARQHDVKQRRCVYCDEIGHPSVNFPKLSAPVERKKYLSEKHLCFNCTGADHRASECRSRSSCTKCKRRHHTSICDASSDNSTPAVTTQSRLLNTATNANKPVIYPVVIVDVNSVKCRALIDTEAGSSYASSALLDTIKATARKTETRRVEMMFGTTTKNVKMYDLKVSDTSNKFIIETEVTRVERNELLTVDNPRYAEIIPNYSHLQGIIIEDKDQKERLPVHLILGTGDYSKIKTATKPRVGSPGEPVAELTKFGWTVMSPGEEVNLNTMFSTQVHREDYEQLCRLDILGLKDSASGDQEDVYSEFKEQLTRSEEGWYETSLPWKGNHPRLASNKAGSIKRLNNLVKKLEKQNVMEQYDKVIKDQIKEGIVEKADQEAQGKLFYLPHKPVVRESAETTKLRIVYDASARENESSPSLNECLETGPPLQNHLWKVLVRGRFHPVALAGDLKQAFLQVRIREEDRDAMRFHWFDDLKTKKVVTLRFTRVLFGLSPSPFLLGGVIQQHIEKYQEQQPDVVEEIKKSLYVDDLLSGGETIEKAKQLKQAATEIFKDATFELHKWHSNSPALQVQEHHSITSPTEQTFAKQQLGVKSGQGALLGLSWDKTRDVIQVEIPQDEAQRTKRGILGKIAKIYDPLGLISPVTLLGKFFYLDCCESKLAWDQPLPKELETRWSSWERSLPDHVTEPRSLPKFQEPIREIELHAFGDASGQGVAATVVAVVRQESGTSRGLIAAKSRLAKKNLTIPRQELVSAHMATNLVANVREALRGFPVQRVFGWLDSTVALHWIRGDGEFNQFVGNRISKIQEKDYIEWRHVPSEENPADLGSRGGIVNDDNRLWWDGPTWLSNEEDLPKNIITAPTKESVAETKPLKEIFNLAVPQTDAFDDILKKWSYWEAMRICGWVSRFVHNVGKKRESIRSP